MSRRVCETCAWFAAGEYERGICAYDFYVLVNNTADVAHEAAKRIRMSDDTCEHWEREENDANEAR